MSRSGASKGTFSAGSSLTCASELSRSASRRSAGTSAPPKRWRPHSAIGCSGVFCRSCEQLHSTQVCGVSREPGMKFLDQARFTQARLADDQHQLAVTLPRPLPAPHQHGDFLVAADERREMALPGAASAAAGTNEPEQHHRLRHALERMCAALLGDEQAGDLALHPRRDHDRARLGQRLHPRRDVGDIAVNLARRIDHHRAGFEADACGQALACRCRRSCGSAQRARAGSTSAARTARSASFSCATG